MYHKSTTMKREEIEKYSITALKRWVKAVYAKPTLRKRIRGLQSKSFFVDLTVCSPHRMSHLNELHRGKNGPTDVLSFPSDEFFQRQGLLGDVVICSTVAIKQAKEIGHDWKKEIDVLLVHGLLHLIGLDHETDEAGAREMGRWEKKILGPKYKNSLITRV